MGRDHEEGVSRMTGVLVTAARGKTGREVTRLLAARPSVRVRAATRDPATLGSNGGEPVLFDWQDPATWEAALDGVRVIYLVRPEIGDAPERIRELLAAAEGVEHVVLLSELGADALPASTWERRVEDAVTGGPAGWTLIRPSWFHQVLSDESYYLEPIRAGTIELATGGGPISFVDTRDIAAVAVEALLEPGHAGQAYTLAGPQAFTFGEVAGKLSDTLGRPVGYVDPPIDETVAWFFGDEPDPFLEGMVRGVLERLRAGVYAELSNDVERVCRRAPRSLDAFIDEHAALWQR
jgi:uncharacterized protein YbjT (DUF2867 family)